MRYNLYVLVIILMQISTATASNYDAISVTHYQGHERYEYGAKLLDLALSKLDIPYKIDVSDTDMVNEARGELEVIRGHLDLQWMSTSSFRESKMIPIRIPIYHGALGLRLLLVNKERKAELESIKDIADLQRYTGGHGLHWGDLPIYDANKLKVIAHKQYESIFKLLKLNRIDYFHRGINEIWAEYEHHQNSLAIADNIMLFYPLPVYFFVTTQRPGLAISLEKGLNLALQDGSFKRLFESYMGQQIIDGKLENRNLIVLKNPDLPPDTPEMGVDWWLPEHHLSNIK